MRVVKAKRAIFLIGVCGTSYSIVSPLYRIRLTDIVGESNPTLDRRRFLGLDLTGATAILVGEGVNGVSGDMGKSA